jgi:hypothetical protein
MWSAQQLRRLLTADIAQGLGGEEALELEADEAEQGCALRERVTGQKDVG